MTVKILFTLSIIKFVNFYNKGFPKSKNWNLLWQKMEIHIYILNKGWFWWKRWCPNFEIAFIMNNILRWPTIHYYRSNNNRIFNLLLFSTYINNFFFYYYWKKIKFKIFNKINPKQTWPSPAALMMNLIIDFKKKYIR